MKFLLFFLLLLAVPFTVQATDCRAIFNDAEALEDVICCDVDLPVFVGVGIVPNYVVGCDSAVFRDRFNFSRSTCLSRGLSALQDQTLSDTPPYLQPWSRDCDNLPVGKATLLENDADDDDDGFSDSEDCNDNSAEIHPGAVESCDGVDNDCDGTVDEGLPLTTWYQDRDGDGYGSFTSVTQCTAPFGYVTNHDDCNDFRGNVHPGAPEICDDWDNDCDGELNEESDDDGDGFTSCANDYSYRDCNDANAAVFPGMIEITCNGLDDDCNPSTLDNVNCPPEPDGPGYPGWEGDEEDQNTNVIPPSTGPADSDAPGYPGWEGDEESSPPSPDTPDAPVGETDSTDVPEVSFPSSGGEPDTGEFLPADDFPDDDLPAGETSGETEEGGSFKLFGGRGCSLFPEKGEKPTAVGLLSLGVVFFLLVSILIRYRHSNVYTKI